MASPQLSYPSLLAIFLFSAMSMATETTTHLHFYVHDRYTGPNSTAVKVVSGPSHQPSPQGFGDMVVIDNLLTEGPDPESKFVGRAQGLLAQVSQDEVAWVLTANLVFMDGHYNGSTLTVIGRNNIMSPAREFSIIGGTGAI